MALTIEIPGRELIELQFLLLDVNGTLSDRGTLLPEVAERLDARPTGAGGVKSKSF
jgi:hypothetical protein